MPTKIFVQISEINFHQLLSLYCTDILQQQRVGVDRWGGAYLQDYIAGQCRCTLIYAPSKYFYFLCQCYLQTIDIDDRLSRKKLIRNGC